MNLTKEDQNPSSGLTLNPVTPYITSGYDVDSKRLGYCLYSFAGHRICMRWLCVLSAASFQETFHVPGIFTFLRYLLQF
jgi:hypothetical protein